MEGPLDIYSDQFQVSTGPYGCALNFMLSNPTPPPPGSAPQAERVATIRMSIEHLKVMTFMLRRQIMVVERDTGVKVEIPVQALNNLRISLEDWQALWKQPEGE